MPITPDPYISVRKTLNSNGLIHSPGVFRALQNDYKISGKTRNRAIKILSAGYGISEAEADKLLSGAIPIEIDDTAGTISYTL